MLENNLKPTPLIEQLKLYLYASKFLFRQKQRRTSSQIKKEYEDGYYQDVLNHKIWNMPNLETICYTRYVNNKLENNNTKSNCIFKEKLCSSTLINLKKLHTMELIKIIKKFTTPDDIICELGCAFGRNLFLFRQNNMTNYLEGYDISKNAMEIAKKIDLKFETKIKFSTFDMTSDFNKIDLHNKIIFTNLALEQLKSHIEQIIGDLVKSGAKKIIHIEHTPQIFNPGLRHTASKIFYNNRDYQNNLYDVLKIFERKEFIEILNIEKFSYSMNPFHELGVIVWKIK